MGLMIHSLCDLPTNVGRDFYVYLLDYGWNESLSREMYRNFPRMAEAASKQGAIVFQGTVGHHFADEVLSWHHINGHDAINLLPAILVTNKHPHDFRENAWNKDTSTDRLLLIPLRQVCQSPNDVVLLIEELFFDIQKRRKLSRFKISEKMIAGQNGAILDALLLKSKTHGSGIAIKKMIGFLKGQNSSSHRFAQLQTPQIPTTRKDTMMIDRKKVFIIHGRNIAAKNAVEQFLRALKLEPIDFDELAADHGASFVGEIVRAGLKRAQGIIALFTADEAAFLRPEYQQSHDSNEDLCRWQSRPNVIFEAGMAYGLAPKRTILAVLGGETKLFSDVKGIHLSFLNNGADSRKRLRQKVIGAGCEVDLRSDTWLDPKRSGDFDSCVLPEASLSSPFGGKFSSISAKVAGSTSAVSLSRPPAKALKHDKAVFGSADNLLSEPALRSFLDRLSRDHSYTDKIVSPIDQFLKYFELTSNTYMIEDLNSIRSNLIDALKELNIFLSTHFFVYPRNVSMDDPDGIRYCMYPEFNIDRGGHGSASEMKFYEKHAAKLHELIDRSEKAYIDYRKAVKQILAI